MMFGTPPVSESFDKINSQIADITEKMQVISSSGNGKVPQQQEAQSQNGFSGNLEERVSKFRDNRNLLKDIAGAIVGGLTNRAFGQNLGHIVAPDYFDTRAREAREIDQIFQNKEDVKNTLSKRIFEGESNFLSSLIEKTLPKREHTSTITDTSITGESTQGSATSSGGGPNGSGGFFDIRDPRVARSEYNKFLRKDLLPFVRQSKKENQLGEKEADFLEKLNQKDLNTLTTEEISQIESLTDQGKLGTFGTEILDKLTHIQKIEDPEGRIPRDLSQFRGSSGLNINEISQGTNEIIGENQEIFNADSLSDNERIALTEKGDLLEEGKVSPYSQSGVNLMKKEAARLAKELKTITEETSPDFFNNAGYRVDTDDFESVKKAKKQMASDINERLGRITGAIGNMEEILNIQKEFKDAQKTGRKEADLDVSKLLSGSSSVTPKSKQSESKQRSISKKKFETTKLDLDIDAIMQDYSKRNEKLALDIINSLD
jgi:hypothetical protein